MGAISPGTSRPLYPRVNVVASDPTACHSPTPLLGHPMSPNLHPSPPLLCSGRRSLRIDVGGSPRLPQPGYDGSLLRPHIDTATHILYADDPELWPSSPAMHRLRSALLDQFRECGILLKMDKMSTVPMDVPTRWNSTYTMLFVAYKFKKVFDRMVENVQFVEYFEEVDSSEKKKRVGPPMEKDWEKARVFVNFLKRFHDTTLQLIATKKTTSPLIWEGIVAMRTVIDETILDTTNPSLQEIAKRMECKFKKYWGNLEKVNKLIFLGHILDPRYKLQMNGIHLGDMNLDTSKIQSFVDSLKNCLMELYHAYKGNSPLDRINGIDDGDVDKDLMEMYKNDPIKLNYHLKMAQVSMVSKMKRENFMEMLGYCVDGNMHLMVYEFATMGSLNDVLHGSKAISTDY
ncbi:hypothetical protein ZIOFF_062443 [Zingiber officinale]|uniref:hAT-like transposase RNase-H fold domain-containing protein n=1 Tax=Zingiber officinale TaxID=94328 RepID=A0A8J5KJ86_ZINOF|nr:hypothetical protein ZIOFF_062443 [Zingiber officinale]